MNYSNNSESHKIISSVSFLVVLLYTLGVTLTIKDGKIIWNCQYGLKYGTTLYIICAILFMYMCANNLSTQTAQYFVPDSIWGFMLWFLIVILGTGVLYMMGNSMPVLKIVLFFVVIFTLAVFMPYLSTKNINSSLIITAIIVSTLTILSQYITLDDSIINYLFIGLITLIIVQLISLWFNYTSSIYSILAIILFSLFIIYDVNRLSKLTCDNTNFIDQGLTIFLDILNMFTNVHRLNNN